VIPGHEVVGVVDRLGPNSGLFDLGERVGVPWLARTCGECVYCISGRENLCLSPLFTGWDLDGGYAPFVVADEQ
jgi:propanol-preferring alcohol dehydrogenase